MQTGLARGFAGPIPYFSPVRSDTAIISSGSFNRLSLWSSLKNLMERTLLDSNTRMDEAHDPDPRSCKERKQAADERGSMNFSRVIYFCCVASILACAQAKASS